MLQSLSFSSVVWRWVGASWTVLRHAPLQLRAQPQSVSKNRFAQTVQQWKVKKEKKNPPSNLKNGTSVENMEKSVVAVQDFSFVVIYSFFFSSLQELLHSSRKLSLKVLSFVQSFQVKTLCCLFKSPLENTHRKDEYQCPVKISAV